MRLVIKITMLHFKNAVLLTSLLYLYYTVQLSIYWLRAHTCHEFTFLLLYSCRFTVLMTFPKWLIDQRFFLLCFSLRHAPCSSWFCISSLWPAVCGGSYWQSLGSWLPCLNGAARPLRRKPSSSMRLPGASQGPWPSPCWPWIKSREMGSVECVS